MSNVQTSEVSEVPFFAKFEPVLGWFYS